MWCRSRSEDIESAACRTSGFWSTHDTDKDATWTTLLRLYFWIFPFSSPAKPYCRTPSRMPYTCARRRQSSQKSQRKRLVVFTSLSRSFQDSVRYPCPHQQTTVSSSLSSQLCTSSIASSLSPFPSPPSPMYVGSASCTCTIGLPFFPAAPSCASPEPNTSTSPTFLLHSFHSSSLRIRNPSSILGSISVTCSRLRRLV